MLIMLLIVLALAIAAGGFGHARFGYYGWSPLGDLLLVLLVLWATGNLHHCHLGR